MVAPDCPVLSDKTDALAHKVRLRPKHHLMEKLHCKVELSAPSQKEERVGDISVISAIGSTWTCRKY